MGRDAGTSRSMGAVPACLVLAFLWCWWFGAAYRKALRPEPGRLVDFYQDWGSARNATTGLPVYAPHEVSVPRHLGFAFPDEMVRVNSHPPTSVLLVLPLAGLDFPDAVLAWNVVSLAALAATLAILGRELGASRALILPALVLVAFFRSVYANVHQGQWALLLGALITGAWALDRHGRKASAGALIGLAASLKLFPAFLLLLYLARREWRPLAAAAAAMAVLVLATAAVLGPSTYVAYLRDVVPTQKVFWGLGFNLSIAGFWHKLFDPVGEGGRLLPLWPDAGLAWGLTLGGVLLLTAMTALAAARATNRASRDAAFALAIVAMMLAAPVTWDEALVQALMPLSWLATATTGRPRERAAWAVAFVVLWLPPSTILSLTPPAWGSPASPYTPWFSVTTGAAKTYALLMLVALAWRAGGRAARLGSGRLERWGGIAHHGGVRGLGCPS